MLEFAIGLAALAAAAAQAAPASNPPLASLPPIDCSSAEHRQMDFWLGTWEVRPVAGGAGPSGRNVIDKVLNGCGIHERFTAPQRAGRPAYQGASYSNYDVHERRWRQFYVDTSGRATWFEGGSNGSGIILWAMEQAPAGSYMRRMEVLPQPDGTVRQAGYISIDNGGSWRKIYDLVYTRVADASR